MKYEYYRWLYFHKKKPISTSGTLSMILLIVFVLTMLLSFTACSTAYPCYAYRDKHGLQSPHKSTVPTYKIKK